MSAEVRKESTPPESATGTPPESGAGTPPEGEAEGLTRGFSEAVARSPRSRSWPMALGGVLLAAALLAAAAPRSESGAAPTEDTRSRSARRGPAPRVESPDDPKTSASAEAASSPGTSDPAVSARVQELALEVQRQALREAEARRKRAAERQRSPIVLFDEARPKTAEGGRGKRSSEAAMRREGLDRGLDLLRVEPARTDRAGGREEAFARDAALETVETVRAERVENPSTLVPQGTFIQGVLETEIQSDLPGMIRAQVSAPVHAFDGSLVIPAGSRLIGRYQSGLVRGQTRVFVIWTRLLRPDGISMRIDSPGTDVLGRAGVGGDVDTHFFEIFGSSILLSLLDGGLDVAKARAQSGDSTILQTGGQDLNRAAEIALQNRVTVAPTIRVPRGTRIQVVASKDLDFAGADSRLD